MTSKIITSTEAAIFSEKFNKQEKKVGFVVGSFDVCHIGHLNLFRLAKKYVDVLIVGLDHDEKIRKTKGHDRPLNSFAIRSDFLSDLATIDLIFLVDDTSIHGTSEAKESYYKILKLINPGYVFTHKECDRHWEDKKELSSKLGINFIMDESAKITSSGEIINKVGAHNLMFK